MNMREGRHQHEKVEEVVADVGSILLGKTEQIRLALCCLLAQGHLLIEDLPGMGKTTLAQGLANALGLSFKRIQFTSDLLPSDILGISIYDKGSESFRFHPGPVFTQLLLADEINRTTPKTQSALLEAMAERQVTMEGVTRPLPHPFFVIATQNPISQAGTYLLPESQQDRFSMCISLGYPDSRAERQILLGNDRHKALVELKASLDEGELESMQADVSAVYVSESLADYVIRLVNFTRESGSIEAGLSTRASLVVLQCARAWALMEGREYVIPEDVQAVFPSVASHRLRSSGSGGDGGAVVQQALNTVDTVS